MTILGFLEAEACALEWRLNDRGVRLKSTNRAGRRTVARLPQEMVHWDS
jgi:hypothetical protein